MSATSKARIIVTLTAEYEGEDVDDYNNAMDDMASAIESAGHDVEGWHERVRVLGVDVTG